MPELAARQRRGGLNAKGIFRNTLGFHFLWIEMEHSPVTPQTLRQMVLATRGLPATVFVRVPVVEPWTTKRVLDQGVSGVILLFAGTPEKAAARRHSNMEQGFRARQLLNPLGISAMGRHS